MVAPKADPAGAFVEARLELVGTALAPAALEPSESARARMLEATFAQCVRVAPMTRPI